MKCEVCEMQEVTRTVPAQGLDFHVCEICADAIGLTSALVDAVKDMGIGKHEAIRIVDASMDGAIGKLTR